MSRRSWIKVPISILDDRRIMQLSYTEFRAYLEGLPKHYDIPEERYSWLRIRKRRMAEVFERDKPVCAYCGSTDKLEIDHIKPLARGGSNELDNLQILCRQCNRKKRDK